jgi:hypothetical protein
MSGIVTQTHTEWKDSARVLSVLPDILLVSRASQCQYVAGRGSGLIKPAPSPIAFWFRNDQKTIPGGNRGSLGKATYWEWNDANLSDSGGCYRRSP